MGLFLELLVNHTTKRTLVCLESCSVSLRSIQTWEVPLEPLRAFQLVNFSPSVPSIPREKKKAKTEAW